MTQEKSQPEFPLEPPLARGRTADIHPWHQGTVLKLFHDWFSQENIEYEAQTARAVHSSGLPVPQAGEIIQVNGRSGLIYERVDGVSMLEAFQRQPWRLFYFARRLAVLHAQMHAVEIAIDLPLLRGRLLTKIQRAAALPPQVRTAALSTLDSLPDGGRICHGDFHPANVMLNARGAVVIDWIDAALGNPLADVARSSILVLGAAASDQIPNRGMKALVRLFHAAYLRHYFRLRPGGEDEYRRWLPVIAAARLEENIPELESWLIAQAEKAGD